MTLPAGTATNWMINPTLTVDACFAVVVDGDNHQTRFNLRDYPEIAAWTLSILDLLLAQEGRLPGVRQIAEPPGGEARQLLIAGRVMDTLRRPDGGPQLRLNPEFNLQLHLITRRRGARAHNVLLPLVEDAELTRWLLNRYARPPLVTEHAPLGEALVASLRRHGILIDEPPPEDAWFPDPAAPVDLVAELATALRVFAQPAGEFLPAEVRRILGGHTPALPPDTAFLWGQDAGTGMVYPTRWTAGVGGQDLSPRAGPEAAQRIAQWDRQRETARVSLRTRRYAELRDILPAAQRRKLRAYARQLSIGGYFPALGDGQVELRAAIHNQSTVAALHKGLAGIVNSICDDPVKASYCYLSCYEAGAVLARHKDRKQCAYNLSLVLDMQGPQGDPEPWPIYLEIDGKPEVVHLQVGDGLCYSGTDIWHWRDALPDGQRAVICFYHFVPQGFSGSLD